MESGNENLDLLPELGDDVELEDDVEVVPPVGSASASGSASIGSTVSKRRLKSDVWSHFNMLPLKPAAAKLQLEEGTEDIMNIDHNKDESDTT